MNLWSQFLAGSRRFFNLGDYSPQDIRSGRIGSAGKTSAGIRVTPDTSLKNAAVWACVQYLTKSVAKLPWRVMRNAASGPERVTSNPVDWLLGNRPCPDMGSFSWRQAMLGNALLWGNGYAEIQRDQRGAVYALWPIHPERVAPRRASNGELEYEVWNRGGNSVISASDMFHIRGFGDGPVGYNVVEYAAQSIGWAQATELFGATYFGSGANPSGVVETAAGMSPDAIDELKAAFNKFYRGAGAEKTVFLDAGMKYTKVSTNPDDSQFIETRQHQLDEICRWFGVPPHKIMNLLRATFSNIEHQSIEVVGDSIMPWVKVFEEEADYKLFGFNRQGLFTKIDIRGMLRGDEASRTTYYKAMFEMGMSINQILALEDLPTIGADGDTRFVSNNVQTLKAALAGKPAAPASAADTVDLTNPASLAAALHQHLLN